MSILEQHQHALAELAKWKLRELELRNKLIGSLPEEFIPDVGKSKTTRTEKLKVSVRRPLNITVNQKEVEGVMSQLDNETAVSVLPARYSLNKRVYSDLSESDKRIIEECLTEKEGQTAISYEEISDED